MEAALIPDKMMVELGAEYERRTQLRLTGPTHALSPSNLPSTGFPLLIILFLWYANTMYRAADGVQVHGI